jgi:hypothetical protein
MHPGSTDSSIGRLAATFLLVLALGLGGMPAGCGDTEEEEPVRGDARVGDSCARNTDCQDGLLCKGGDLRCVRLCEIGSEECGEGIVCEPANDGEVGFCPLPPA